MKKKQRKQPAPPKEFVQSKSRVGQKKRLPENQTRAEIKVKPVKVARQTNVTSYESKGPYVTSRNLTLEEVIAQVGVVVCSCRNNWKCNSRDLLSRD